MCPSLPLPASPQPRFPTSGWVTLPICSVPPSPIHEGVLDEAHSEGGEVNVPPQNGLSRVGKGVQPRGRPQESGRCWAGERQETQGNLLPSALRGATERSRADPSPARPHPPLSATCRSPDIRHLLGSCLPNGNVAGIIKLRDRNKWPPPSAARPARSSLPIPHATSRPPPRVGRTKRPAPQGSGARWRGKRRRRAPGREPGCRGGEDEVTPQGPRPPLPGSALTPSRGAPSSRCTRLLPASLQLGPALPAPRKATWGVLRVGAPTERSHGHWEHEALEAA